MTRSRITPALVCATALVAPCVSALEQGRSPEPSQASVGRLAGTTYRVVNLGGGWPTDLPRINNRGQVAFSVRTYSANSELGYHARFYDGATVRDLGNLGADHSFAIALNDAGDVAGRSEYQVTDSYEGAVHAFRWRAGTGMVDLGALPLNAYSYATAVNNAGNVVGASSYQGRIDERYHAVRWSPAGSITDLGTFFGASSASTINDAGQIAGGVGFADGNVRAFFWTAARGMTDLGSLGSGQSTPVAMNASGQIAGDSPLVQDQESHAFFWQPGRHMIDLGTLGGTRSRSVDINDAGQVVGVATTAGGQERAFIWHGGGRIADIGTLAGQDTAPGQINDHGVVVGQSLLQNGAWHAFSWTRAGGMVDLNKRLAAVPSGLVIDYGAGIGNDGTILAMSNAGLVVLKPGPGRDAAPLLGPVVNAASGRSDRPFGAVIHFLDIDPGETHRGTWDWGDGSKPEAATVSERNGQGTLAGSHRYREAGEYLVVMTATDSGGRQSSSASFVTVCDPASRASCAR